MTAVLLKNISPPPFDRKEILRYAGCRCADPSVEKLLDDCIAEAMGCLVYKVCYAETDVKTAEGSCSFANMFDVKSEKLAVNLGGCNKAVIMGATVGVGLDRLIAKYGVISPSRAVMLQAVGAERIEALCDAFCRSYEVENGVSLKPRFSPGYGDLSLDCQRDIFLHLGLTKNIGITLNGSLLMTPSKSVTAFVGVTDSESQNCKTDKCAECEKTDCAFRGKI